MNKYLLAVLICILNWNICAKSINLNKGFMMKYYNGSKWPSELNDSLIKAHNYRYGNGCRMNLKKSFQLFSKCAGEGHPYANYMCGSMLINELGVKCDPMLGHNYFIKAAKLGSPEALCSLGYFYMEGCYGTNPYDSSDAIESFKTKPDFNKGYSYYVQAIEHSSIKAYNHLLEVYLNNKVHKGAMKQLIMMNKWAWKKKKWVRGAYQLGELYLVGCGVKKDHEKARCCFEEVVNFVPHGGYASYEEENDANEVKSFAKEALKNLNEYEKSMTEIIYHYLNRIDTKPPLWDDKQGVRPKGPWEIE